MMPDITKCEGTGCAKKETCYRFKSAPSEFKQAYFVTPPFIENGSCTFFVPLRVKGRRVASGINETNN